MGLASSEFSPGYYPGPSVTQIQGIVGANLLLGKPVTASSAYNANFVPSTVTDGLANEFAFADDDSTRSMFINGFDSAVNLIRIWAVNDRFPSTVMIESTTVANSTNPGDYTTLATVANPVFNSQGFMDVAVNASAGTQGLEFLFGPGSNAPGTGISEIQAFATGQVVPEPPSIALVACGVTSLLAYAWRKRK